MSSCIFCRVLAGELPSEKIFESETHVAILDIQPVRPGHTLVVAKQHIEKFVDADPKLGAELLATAQKLAPAILAATGHEACNFLINNGSAAGQLIPHLHLHVIPRTATDGIRFGWRQTKYPDGQMAQVAASIRAKLS